MSTDPGDDVPHVVVHAGVATVGAAAPMTEPIDDDDETEQEAPGDGMG